LDNFVDVNMSDWLKYLTSTTNQVMSTEYEKRVNSDITLSVGKWGKKSTPCCERRPVGHIKLVELSLNLKITGSILSFENNVLTKKTHPNGLRHLAKKLFFANYIRGWSVLKNKKLNFLFCLNEDFLLLWMLS